MHAEHKRLFASSTLVAAPKNLLLRGLEGCAGSRLVMCLVKAHRKMLKVSSRFWCLTAVYFRTLKSRHTKLYSKQRAFAPIWHWSTLEGNTDLGSRCHVLSLLEIRLSDRPLYYCCQLCQRHAPIKVVIVGKRPRLLKHPPRAGDPACRIWRSTWRVSQAKMRLWISPQALCHDWPECPSGRDKLQRTWVCLLAVN
jgi:hypothetical protein